LRLAEAVAELNPPDDLGQSVLTVELSPFALRRQHQFERHGQTGLPAQAALGAFGSMPHGGECALDGVRCPDVFPVLGREVVAGQQRVAILDQLGDCLVSIHAVGFDEEVECGFGLDAGFGLPDVVKMRLGL
jgi:hypothetical protein